MYTCAWSTRKLSVLFARSEACVINCQIRKIQLNEPVSLTITDFYLPGASVVVVDGCWVVVVGEEVVGASP